MNQLFGLVEEEKMSETERLVMLHKKRDKMIAKRDRRTVRSESTNECKDKMAAKRDL
jgi:hypothetical protein